MLIPKTTISLHAFQKPLCGSSIFISFILGGAGEPEDGIEEVSPGVVAAAAAARRARRAGPHTNEAALFRELEQAESGFSAGVGANHSEAALGGAKALLLDMATQGGKSPLQACG